MRSIFCAQQVCCLVSQLIARSRKWILQIRCRHPNRPPLPGNVPCVRVEVNSGPLLCGSSSNCAAQPEGQSHIAVGKVGVGTRPCGRQSLLDQTSARAHDEQSVSAIPARGGGWGAAETKKKLAGKGEFRRAVAGAAGRGPFTHRLAPALDCTAKIKGTRMKIGARMKCVAIAAFAARTARRPVRPRAGPRSAGSWRRIRTARTAADPGQNSSARRPSRVTSTRRLRRMPAAVALEATGLPSPWPATRKRARVTPISSSASRTLCARRSDRS